MKYLIDTDWLIDHLKGIQVVGDKLIEFSQEGLSMSIISLAEVYEGIFGSRNQERHQQALNEFLASDLDVLEVTEDICKVFAQERSKLRKQGLLIGDFDLLIAATALYHNLTVLTNNRKHFERIENLEIISIHFS